MLKFISRPAPKLKAIVARVVNSMKPAEVVIDVPAVGELIVVGKL